MENYRHPKVCVAIPVYNAEMWISRAIQSVLGQNYPDLCLIVVDDGSIDNSANEIELFANDLLFIKGENRGACHARNLGLQAAKESSADYILFLDADDYLEGDIIAGSVNQALGANVDMVVSNMHLRYKDGSCEKRFLYKNQIQPEEFYKGWMSGSYVNPSGILWRVDFIERIGGWDESLARAQDLEITLRALQNRPCIWKNETGAAIHARVNPASISNNQSEQALQSRFRAVSGLVDSAQGTTFSEYDGLMYREIYHIASAAFRYGHIALGRRIVGYLKEKKYRKHPGTRLHAVVAGIIGLENKTRLRKCIGRERH